MPRTLVFTDPPYNVNYEGYTEDRLTIQGDRMTDDQFRKFLVTIFGNYRRIMKPGASLYVCHPSSWQREFQNALEAAGFEVRCQIIRAKNTFAWGFGRYKFRHEPIFMRTWLGKATLGTAISRNPRSGRKTNQRLIACIPR
jgi:DNA modification methylase